MNEDDEEFKAHVLERHQTIRAFAEGNHKAIGERYEKTDSQACALFMAAWMHFETDPGGMRFAVVLAAYELLKVEEEDLF